MTARTLMALLIAALTLAPENLSADPSCPPVGLIGPLPGVEELAFSSANVSTAIFPAAWAEGRMVKQGWVVRVFPDGTGTVAQDARLRGWHVDFTCDAGQNKCRYSNARSAPEAAVTAAKAIGTCLTAKPQKPHEEKAKDAATTDAKSTAAAAEKARTSPDPKVAKPKAEVKEKPASPPKAQPPQAGAAFGSLRGSAGPAAVKDVPKPRSAPPSAQSGSTAGSAAPKKQPVAMSSQTAPPMPAAIAPKAAATGQTQSNTTSPPGPVQSAPRAELPRTTVIAADGGGQMKAPAAQPAPPPLPAAIAAKAATSGQTQSNTASPPGPVQSAPLAVLPRATVIAADGNGQMKAPSAQPAAPPMPAAITPKAAATGQTQANATPPPGPVQSAPLAVRPGATAITVDEGGQMKAPAAQPAPPPLPAAIAPKAATSVQTQSNTTSTPGPVQPAPLAVRPGATIIAVDGGGQMKTPGAQPASPVLPGQQVWIVVLVSGAAYPESADCWVDHLPEEPVSARIQRMLLLSGFDAGPVDGKPGLRTARALEQALGARAAMLDQPVVAARLRSALCRP